MEENITQEPQAESTPDADSVVCHRMKQGRFSVWSQAVFCAGILTLWIVAAYFNGNIVGMVLGGAAIVAGLGLAIWGSHADYVNFISERKNNDELGIPHSPFSTLGGFAIGLGLIGLVAIAIGNDWSNSTWLVVEILSLVGGLVLVGTGFFIDRLHQKHFNSQNLM